MLEIKDITCAEFDEELEGYLNSRVKFETGGLTMEIRYINWDRHLDDCENHQHIVDEKLKRVLDKPFSKIKRFFSRWI